MASSVNGHDGKYQRAAHGQPRHSALTDGDGAAAYALPWSDDDLRAFDYTALDAETRIVVQQRTGEIKSLMRRTAQDIIEIGLKLTEVKARLGHGSFGGWLKAEFEWSERTAQNFMRVADAFKSATVADLIAPKALYLLAAPSTPDEARAEALEQASAGGRLSVRQAKELIERHRAAEAVELVQAVDSARPEIAAVVVQHGVTDPQLVRLLNAKQDTDTVQSVLASGCLQDGETVKPLAAATAWDLQGLLRKGEREHREAARDARIDGKLAQIQQAPPGVFSVIYADPPWQYSNSGLHGAAERHYPTLPTPEIKTLPARIGLETTGDAVLFLWATNPLLVDALEVVAAWGFQYKTNLVWMKDRATHNKLGFYAYGQHELLLLATRGSFLPKYLPNSVLDFAKTAHSEKPQAVYSLIETMYPQQRYVELFARAVTPRDGWAFWGAETDVPV